ncbi:MAG TPA: SRPBCC domain-containing protein [Anaerolineaceae bacterium]
MKSEATTLHFEKNIKAQVKDCYRAFTNQVAFEEWFCNTAEVDVALMSKLYLWWNSGYYMCGEFIKVDPEKEIVFSWLGKDDPGKTRVRITFKTGKSATRVTVEHRGIKSSPRWSAAAQQIQHGWEVALENLVSILETGRDLRLVNRPMLGININEFSPEIAAKLAVPVTLGVRLVGVVDGMGAQICGLKKDDVLVEVAGIPMLGYTSLSAILQGKKAGDKVDVTFYRGPEKITTTMELFPRPIPKIPATLGELAQTLEEMYTRSDQEVEHILQNVSEIEASFRPDAGEWNVREILAHLIHTERDLQFFIHKLVVNEDFFSPSNLQARIDAIVVIYPTITDLKLELKRAEAETVAFIRSLPDEFTSRKDRFWVLAYNLLQLNDHPLEHSQQIKDTLDACRNR